MDGIDALKEIAFWLERERAETRRVEAYRKAAWTLQALPPHMAVDGWIYLESPVDQAPSPPSGWRLHRELRTAQARAALYRVAATPGAAGDTPGAECADTLAAANPAP